MGLTLALILTFSPGEKEQPSHVSGLANDFSGNVSRTTFQSSGERFSSP